MRISPRRPAFTLIELLVVMAVMIVLLAIVAGVANSGAFDSQKVVSAADRSSGWLIIAKQRAKRDGAPRGVRFIRSQPGSGFTEAQYIEAPDQWAPNPDQEFNPHGPRIVFAYQYDTTTNTYDLSTPRVYFVSFDPTLPNPATNPANVARQADITTFLDKITINDLLVLPEIGGPYRITGINTPSGTNLLHLSDSTIPSPPNPPVLVPPENCRILTLATTPQLGAAFSPRVNVPTIPNALGTLTTYKYGFQPAPRPLMGEPLLQLTSTTIIDVALPGDPSTSLGVNVDPAGHFDLLFSPSGQLLNNSSGIVCLWVRDPGKIPNSPRRNPGTGLQDDVTGYDLAGEQVLVTIYSKTGFIATHPISTLNIGTPAYDPWLNAKDGVNSGF